jgi:hypothetical protein
VTRFLWQFADTRHKWKSHSAYWSEYVISVRDIRRDQARRIFVMSVRNRSTQPFHILVTWGFDPTVNSSCRNPRRDRPESVSRRAECSPDYTVNSSSETPGEIGQRACREELSVLPITPWTLALKPQERSVRECVEKSWVFSRLHREL